MHKKHSLQNCANSMKPKYLTMHQDGMPYYSISYSTTLETRQHYRNCQRGNGARTPLVQFHQFLLHKALSATWHFVPKDTQPLVSAFQGSHNVCLQLKKINKQESSSNPYPENPT